MLVEPVKTIPSKIISLPTYDEFAQAFKERYERYPCGSEMLMYWDQHPDEQRRMCPNAAKVRS